MTDVKTIGISAIIGMLLMAGIIYVPNTLSPQPQYYCTSNSGLTPMYCDHLSSTGSRCYPQANTTKGYKDCVAGWSLIVFNETNQTSNITQINNTCSWPQIQINTSNVEFVPGSSFNFYGEQVID